MGSGSVSQVGDIGAVSDVEIGRSEDRDFQAASTLRGEIVAVDYCEQFKACTRCKVKLQQVCIV